ncbi:hypothetical protein [Gordonia hankookensis]|uniref:Type VII secretion-associated protein n=1 Tax=Gordonia hankookensis TaxID=589403 RepID=A0ABR7WI94_9ACTN|nr:hypothetical protein [Gordonia hankookensis]MBD1322480.1 hypothetical protein [Gordonia hankookensis]
MRSAEIGDRQLASGVPTDQPFLLVDVADDGLLISAVDPAAGTTLDQRVLWSVHPIALDQALAEHLVRAGRVPTPRTDDWWNELRELAGRGRERLSTSDGTFVMGHRDVRFFRVSRRDLDEATASLATEVSSMVREMGQEFGATSVVIGRGGDDWPGLDAVLQRQQLPVITAAPPVDGNRDVGVPEGVSAVWPAPMPTPEPAPPKPAHPEPTVLEPVAPHDPQQSVASASVSAQSARYPGKRIVIAMAAVVAVIGVGTVTALVATGSDSPHRPPSSLEFPSSTPSPTSSYADPAELVAAREPAVDYTPPPPPPAATDDGSSNGTPQSPGQPNRPRSAPPRVVIPIPGLPPIVLPRLPG